MVSYWELCTNAVQNFSGRFRQLPQGINRRNRIGDRTETIGRMDKGNSGHAGGAVIALDIAQVHRSLQMVSLTDKADILPLGKTGAAEALLIADIFIQLIIV